MWVDGSLVPRMQQTYVLDGFRFYSVPLFKQLGQLVQSTVMKMKNFVLRIQAGDDELAACTFGIRVEQTCCSHFSQVHREQRGAGCGFLLKQDPIVRHC